MTAPKINTDGTSANGGKVSTFGAIVSILGVVSALYPKSVPVVSAVQAAAPVLHDTVPAALTAVGAVVAAFGHPPAWLRRIFGK